MEHKLYVNVIELTLIKFTFLYRFYIEDIGFFRKNVVKTFLEDTEPFERKLG
jgi:hypothetical protein